MTRKLNGGLALAAGLLGGMLSHYVTPALVHAQAPEPQPKPEIVPQEVKAHSFVLVNDANKPSGVIGFDKDGNAYLTLLDKTDRVIWSSQRRATLAPLTASNQK